MKKVNVTRKSLVKIPLTLIAGVLLLVCAFVYADHNTGIHRTFQTATSHQPENFTELYFSNYSSLHHVLKVGTLYPVVFTISNHESKTFTYVYQTELAINGKTVKSKPTTLTVDNGKSVQQTAHITAKRPGEAVELVVQVLNKNLTIHYKAQS